MESKQFESRSIFFEAKRPISLEAGLGQAASYMGTCGAYLFVTESNSSTVGIHTAGESDQPKEIISRKNPRCCVVSNGVDWQFLRLDGNELQISVWISRAIEERRREM